MPSPRRPPFDVRIFLATCSLLIGVPGCAAGPSASASSPAAALPATGVDHVIVSIDSLERGIELMREATGVTPVFGGVHPGRGTQNALLSLGPGRYLELLAPNPSDSAGPERVEAFRRFRSLTPTGWFLHASDADSARARAVRAGLPGGDVRPGSRARSDGSVLRWRAFSPWAMPRMVLPLFIEWDPAGPHPSTDSPGGCMLAEISLEANEPDSLRALLALASVDVPVGRGAADRIRLVLDCPTGRVRLP